MVERKKLGEILLQAGVISAEQLKEALEDQRRYGGHLGTILLDRRYIDEKAFLYALSQQLKIPAVDFSKSTIPEAVIHLVSQEIQEKNLVFPVATKRTPSGNVLILGMSDPTNVEIQDHIRFLTGYRVEPVVALESVIRQAIREYWYRQEGRGSYQYRPDADLGAIEHGNIEIERDDGIHGERVINFNEAEKEISPPKPDKTAKAGFSGEEVKAKPSRELLALLRLLARKKIITEKEFMDELKKTK